MMCFFFFRNEIWCKAITKDNWTELDSNAPLDAIQDLLFFRLAELCITLGKYILYNYFFLYKSGNYIHLEFFFLDN